MIKATKEQLREKFDLMLCHNIKPVISNSRGVKFVVQRFLPRGQRISDTVSVISDEGSILKLDLERILEDYNLEF